MEASVPDDEDNSSNEAEEETLFNFVTKFINNLDKQTSNELPKAIPVYNRFQCFLFVGRNPVRLRLLSYLLGQHMVLTRKDQDVHLLRYNDNSSLIHPESAFRLLTKYNFRDAHFLKCLKIFKLPTRDDLIEHLLSLNIADNHISPGTVIVDDLTNWIQSIPPNESAGTSSDTQNFAEDTVETKRRFLHLTCAALQEAISYYGSIYSGETMPTPEYLQPVSKKALLIVTLDLSHFFFTLYPAGLPPKKRANTAQIISELANEFFFEGCIDADKI